jgi:hypothetical protein
VDIIGKYQFSEIFVFGNNYNIIAVATLKIAHLLFQDISGELAEYMLLVNLRKQCYAFVPL